MRLVTGAAIWLAITGLVQTQAADTVRSACLSRMVQECLSKSASPVVALQTRQGVGAYCASEAQNQCREIDPAAEPSQRLRADGANLMGAAQRSAGVPN